MANIQCKSQSDVIILIELHFFYPFLLVQTDFT